jgi:hypothetical protein
MVDEADLDWNLLLADLRKLSVMAENRLEESSDNENPAASISRQKQQ